MFSERSGGIGGTREVSVGPIEVAIVLVLFLLVFGARKVPEAGRALGTGLREFKRGIAQAKEPFELATRSMEPERRAQRADADRT